jgi:hypothetical protein
MKDVEKNGAYGAYGGQESAYGIVGRKDCLEDVSVSGIIILNGSERNSVGDPSSS